MTDEVLLWTSLFKREHTVIQSLRIYMCPADKVPCCTTGRNSIAPVRGPSHLLALESDHPQLICDRVICGLKSARFCLPTPQEHLMKNGIEVVQRSSASHCTSCDPTPWLIVGPHVARSSVPHSILFRFVRPMRELSRKGAALDRPHFRSGMGSVRLRPHF